MRLIEIKKIMWRFQDVHVRSLATYGTGLRPNPKPPHKWYFEKKLKPPCNKNQDFRVARTTYRLGHSCVGPLRWRWRPLRAWQVRSARLQDQMLPVSCRNWSSGRESFRLQCCPSTPECRPRANRQRVQVGSWPSAATRKGDQACQWIQLAQQR